MTGTWRAFRFARVRRARREWMRLAGSPVWVTRVQNGQPVEDVEEDLRFFGPGIAKRYGVTFTGGDFK